MGWSSPAGPEQKNGPTMELRLAAICSCVKCCGVREPAVCHQSHQEATARAHDRRTRAHDCSSNGVCVCWGGQRSASKRHRTCRERQRTKRCLRQKCSFVLPGCQAVSCTACGRHAQPPARTQPHPPMSGHARKRLEYLICRCFETVVYIHSWVGRQSRVRMTSVSTAPPATGSAAAGECADPPHGRAASLASATECGARATAPPRGS